MWPNSKNISPTYIYIYIDFPEIAGDFPEIPEPKNKKATEIGPPKSVETERLQW